MEKCAYESRKQAVRMPCSSAESRLPLPPVSQPAPSVGSCTNRVSGEVERLGFHSPVGQCGMPSARTRRVAVKCFRMGWWLGGGVPAWRAEHPLVSGGASLAG